MTNETENLFTHVAEAIALFDAALPGVIEVLGADHPAVISAIEAAEEVKQQLRDAGYNPPSLH